jgi:hypothetical protein
MQTLLRISGVVSGVVFVFALLAFGLLPMRYTGVFSDVLKAGRDHGELLQRLESNWRYRENQYQAVQEWIDQRCTLEETIQRFQEMDREYAQVRPCFPSTVYPRLPQSDEERYYLCILGRVESILNGQGRAKELAVARRRLEQEYQQLQARCPKSELETWPLAGL